MSRLKDFSLPVVDENESDNSHASTGGTDGTGGTLKEELARISEPSGGMSGPAALLVCIGEGEEKEAVDVPFYMRPTGRRRRRHFVSSPNVIIARLAALLLVCIRRSR